MIRINPDFITGLNGPDELGLLGNDLLVANFTDPKRPKGVEMRPRPTQSDIAHWRLRRHPAQQLSKVCDAEEKLACEILRVIFTSLWRSWWLACSCFVPLGLLNWMAPND